MNTTILSLLLLFVAFPITGFADTIREAVPFTAAEIKAIPAKMAPRVTDVSRAQRNILVKALKQKEGIAPKEILKSLSEKDVGKISVMDLTLVLGDLQIAKEFRSHEEPLIRFIANYYMAKSGQQGAAIRLKTLIDDDTLTKFDARYLKTRFNAIGIDVKKDSAEDIGKYLARIARKFPSIPLGSDIPDLSFTDIAGRFVSLKDFRGKIVILHYWATWCLPCMEELESLAKRLETLDSEKYVIVFVSLDFDQKSHSKAIEKLPKQFQFTCDGKSARSPITSTFAVSHIPSNIIISPEGKLTSVSLSELFPKERSPDVARPEEKESGTKR